jgi:hypothetical protein
MIRKLTAQSSAFAGLVPLPLVGRGRGGGREVLLRRRRRALTSRPPPLPPHKGEGEEEN